jgi:hypothetical protein
VLDKNAPGKPQSVRSKRWWTDDIKQERRLFGRARRDYNNDRISLGDYRRVRNDYYSYIRRAKRLAWEHFLEGAFPTDKESELAADPGRCWEALKYTKEQVPSYTPAIKIKGVDGQPDRVAASAEEKEEVFMAQAFPPQSSSEENVEILNTSVKASVDDIRVALFEQSVKKAPGVDGIGFKAVRLLWRWAEDRIVALI